MISRAEHWKRMRARLEEGFATVIPKTHPEIGAFMEFPVEECVEIGTLTFHGFPFANERLPLWAHKLELVRDVFGNRYVSEELSKALGCEPGQSWVQTLCSKEGALPVYRARVEKLLALALRKAHVGPPACLE